MKNIAGYFALPLSLTSVWLASCRKYVQVVLVICRLIVIYFLYTRKNRCITKKWYWQPLKSGKWHGRRKYFKKLKKVSDFFCFTFFKCWKQKQFLKKALFPIYEIDSLVNYIKQFQICNFSDLFKQKICYLILTEN